MRRNIAAAVIFLLSVGIVPLARHFMSSTPEWLWRLAAVAAGFGVVAAACLVPFYSWVSNPSEHPIGSTLFITLWSAAIAVLCWLLFVLNIGSPEFKASIFAAFYEPSTHTFSADVLYTNDSPIQRTVVGGTFIFHKRGSVGSRATLSPPGRTAMLGDTQYLTVDPGKTAVGHYHEALAPTYVRDFNAIALTPSGELSGESETGLQFISLTPDGTRQSKDVFFMSVHVDEGVCELRMFQPKKFSLDATGDIFLN